MVRGKNIHTVCCGDNYFPQGKFNLFNSLFHSVSLFFSIRLSLLPICLPCVSCGTYCNEDKRCVVTHRAANIRVAWLVYVRTYCVPIATLDQNKRFRLLYLGDAQIIGNHKIFFVHLGINKHL